METWFRGNTPHVLQDRIIMLYWFCLSPLQKRNNERSAFGYSTYAVMPQEKMFLQRVASEWEAFQILLKNATLIE